MVNTESAYWEGRYYQLLRKYDRLLSLYEEEIRKIDDVVAFEKRELSDEANETNP